MTEETQTESKELIIKPGEIAKVMKEKLGVKIKELIEKHQEIPDVNAEGGYDQIVLVGQNLQKARLEVEAKRKQIKAPYLELGKEIDKAAEEITKPIVDLEKRYKEARKDEEVIRDQVKADKKAEKERLNNEFKELVQWIKDLPSEVVSGTVEDLEEAIERLKDQPIDEDSFGQYVDQAEMAKELSLMKLTSLLRARKEQEEERERLENDRKELEEKQKAQKKIDDNNERIRLDQEEAQKKIDEAQAKIDTDREAAEATVREAEEARLETARLKEVAAKQAEQEVLDKARKDREAAEALAHKKERRLVTFKEINLYVKDEEKTEFLLKVIEDRGIPFVHVDWGTR